MGASGGLQGWSSESAGSPSGGPARERLSERPVSAEVSRGLLPEVLVRWGGYGKARLGIFGLNLE